MFRYTDSVFTDSVIGKGDRHIYPYAWDIPPIVDIYMRCYTDGEVGLVVTQEFVILSSNLKSGN